MSLNKPVRRIAIIRTGLVGASWPAEFLARGLDVIATDVHGKLDLVKIPGLLNNGSAPRKSPGCELAPSRRWRRAKAPAGEASSAMPAQSRV